MNLAIIVVLFMIYSVIGWIVEVIDRLIIEKKLII